MPTMWLSDTQKIGAVFCSGGALFMIFGLLLFFDRALLAMGYVPLRAAKLMYGLLITITIEISSFSLA
jgi:hypothetical protein